MEEYINSLNLLSIRHDLVQKFDYNAHVNMQIIDAFAFKRLYGVSVPIPEFYYGISDLIVLNNPRKVRELFRYLKNNITGKFCLMVNFYNYCHCNLLIYDAVKKQLIGYEPNGKGLGEDYIFFKCGEIFDEIYKIAKKEIPELQYVKSFEIHSNIGLQSCSKRGNQGGLCQLWSRYMMNLIYKFPEMEIKDIIDAHIDPRKSFIENRRYLKRIIAAFKYKLENYISRNIQGFDLNRYTSDHGYVKEIYKIVNDEFDNGERNSENLLRFLLIDFDSLNDKKIRLKVFLESYPHV